MKRKPPAIVSSQKELAAALGCTDRHVRNYLAAGMPRLPNGTYDVGACRLWVANNIRPKGNVRPGGLGERRQRAHIRNLEIQTRTRRFKLAALRGAGKTSGRHTAVG